MTYLQLCQWVRRKCAVGSSGPTSVTGQTGKLDDLVEWVADAWLDIQNMRDDWDFMWEQFDSSDSVITSSGVSTYDLGRLRGFLYLDGDRLTYYDYDDFRFLVDECDLDELSGNPKYWTIRPDDSIEIAPTPTSIMYFSGEKYGDPTTLAADSDVPTLPEKHMDVIKWLAVLFYAEDQEAIQLYQLAAARYESAMARLTHSQLPSLDFTGAMV